MGEPSISYINNLFTIYIQIETTVQLIETPVSTATDFLSSTFPSDGKVARHVRWPMEGLLANKESDRRRVDLLGYTHR